MVALGQGVWGERTENNKVVQTAQTTADINVNSKESNIQLNKDVILLIAGAIICAFTVCILLAKKNNLLYLCEKREEREPEFLDNKAT